MQALSIEFKVKVSKKLKEAYDSPNYVNVGFLRHYELTSRACVDIIGGKIEGVLTDQQWLRLGSKLNVKTEKVWNLARTDVFTVLEEDILFCKDNAKAKICVDECGIGKTFTAKYLSKTLENCFYVDASQGKTILQFTKALASSIGLNIIGKHADLKQDIKCYLKIIDKPMVIIDEAGDLGQVTLQEIKEYWNATEGFCGWYLMGADGLRYTIEKGIKLRKPGFKEIFSRFSERYTTVVPIDKKSKILFYKKLIRDVLSVNMSNTKAIDDIVTRCLTNDLQGTVTGLRRAESLLILTKTENIILTES